MNTEDAAEWFDADTEAEAARMLGLEFDNGPLGDFGFELMRRMIEREPRTLAEAHTVVAFMQEVTGRLFPEHVLLERGNSDFIIRAGLHALMGSVAKVLKLAAAEPNVVLLHSIN